MEIKNFILQKSTPFIALVKNKEEQHYVVVYNCKSDKFLVSNPELPKLIWIKEKDFQKIFLNIILVPLPKKEIIDKKKLKSNNFKRICRYFYKENKFKIILIGIISLIVSICAVILAFYLRVVADIVIPKNMRNFLTIVSISFILIILISNILEYSRNQMLIYLIKNFEHKLSKLYFEKVTRMPLHFFKKRPDGEVITRFNDSLVLKEILANLVLIFFSDMILFCLAGGLLFVQNKMLFVLSLIPIILYLFFSYYFYEKIEKYSQETIVHGASVNNLLFQVIKSSESILSFNQGEIADRFILDKYNRFLDSMVKQDKIVNLNNMFKKIIRSLVNITIIWIGCMQIFMDQLSLGQLLTFSALLAYFVGAAENIMNLQPTFQKSLFAADRFFEVIDYPDSLSKKVESKINTIKTIKIKKMEFSYNRLMSIKLSFDIEIEANDKIMLVGKTGCGKSTIAKMIPNLISPPINTIFINEIDLLDLDKYCIREKILYLSSDCFFIKETILRNLDLNNEYSLEEIKRICFLLNFDEIIGLFDIFINNLIDESAKNLSLGQKQLIMLIRALLKKPEVLIVDEALANIDIFNRKKIIEVLLEMNITLIYISHTIEEKDFFGKIYKI
ncbi:ABC transporter transmembrane domain-containing protein [Paenibacillus sp. WLX2291]|uniref:ABC transporter transmembrane domain-containing protein n=1 Tax=Paenibacillus sp. WLX2291 TaxID=3296934 RepID=UPI00398404D8